MFQCRSPSGWVRTYASIWSGSIGLEAMSLILMHLAWATGVVTTTLRFCLSEGDQLVGTHFGMSLRADATVANKPYAAAGRR